jgi:Glycosyltransferase WbsX
VSQELGGASRTGVTVRYDRSSALADAPAGRAGEGSQGLDHGIGVIGDQNRVALRQQVGQTRPAIADDRRAASGRLEQPDTGRPAGGDHCRAGDIQREALRCVKCRMVSRRQMFDPLHVSRPFDIPWILRPRDHEAHVGQAARGLQQQPLEGRLTIRAVGTEIAEIPSGWAINRSIPCFVDRAVQRAGPPSAEFVSQAIQGGTAGEREIEVQFRYLTRGQIGFLARIQSRKGDRSVDVVEPDGAAGGAEDDVDRSDQAVVKAVRADTHPDTKSCLLIDFLAPKQVDVRYIAFYLPQFHPVPENDKWWGKGFTEWTNVSKAWPMFDGHYQPHLPADFGFYDLRVRDVQRQQIEYAKTNGIDAFCFHYYSFGERRILERPLEDYLADSKADFPFCLCWANENWTRRWDAADQEVLIAQDYSPANDVSLIEDLLRFFRDRRYVRINGAPLLVVYRPQQLPDAKATAARWRSICRDSGIGEIHLVAALTHGNWDYESLGFDAGVEFPPHDPGVPTCLDEVRPYVEIEGFILRYGALAERYLANDYRNRLVYRGVCPSWDNSARVQTRALITLDATPDNYERWLSRTTSLTLQERSPQERLVFINAWNEWAEGCHLEPDRRYGMAWLDATLRVKAGRSVVSRVFESVDGLTLSVRKPRPLIRWIDRGLKGTPQLHRRAQAIWGRVLNGKSKIFRDSTLVD